jgi:glutathione S-transferase
MWDVLIPVIAAIIASAGAIYAIYLTKKKERAAEWRSKKLAYYEEFLGAVSGIVGNAPATAKIRFAHSVNNLHLIGSANVIVALHAFTDEIAKSNSPHRTTEKHDQLWSALVWEIRADLGDPPGAKSTFGARLWDSGAGTNSVP